MGKHGAMTPIGLHKSMGADNAPSQPTQAEIDHTSKMNAWFVESFNNMFVPKLTPYVELIVDEEIKRLNETIVSTNRELAYLHKQVAGLAEIVKRAMTADRFQKHMQYLDDEFDITVHYSINLYDDDKVDKEKTRAAANEPSIFTVTMKAKSKDDVAQPQPTLETKSWLKWMMGK